MAEEMDRRQAELNEAQEMIRRLEEQLKQLQAAKEELENRQKVSHSQVCTFNVFDKQNIFKCLLSTALNLLT